MYFLLLTIIFLSHFVKKKPYETWIKITVSFLLLSKIRSLNVTV